MVTDEAFTEDFWRHHLPCAASHYLFYRLLENKRKEDEMNRLSPDQAAAVRAAEQNQVSNSNRDIEKAVDRQLRQWCVEQAIKAHETEAISIATEAASIYDFMCGKGET